MTWWNVFDKLDDALKVVVDATFGWSGTLQEGYLEKIRTRNQKEISETRARLDAEKSRLEGEIRERDERFQRELEKERNIEKQEQLKVEQKLYHQDMEFKVKMVGKITAIVSGLQNEHSRRVMALLTEYKQQQIFIIDGLKESHKRNMREIADESKQFKEEHPEIYKIKMEQLRGELGSHQKLLGDITDGMSTDLQNIQKWLLDSSRFNAEEFVLKISGSKDEARNFQHFLDERKIDVNLLRDEG
jgi:hypothetical protein